MRAFNTNGKISIHAIAGTNVVLFGLNASDKARKGLLGFTIEKKRGKGAFKPLRGGPRKFENFDIDESGSSRDVPIQSMMWSDYDAKPGTAYTFKVTPLYGRPDGLKPGASVQVQVTTEKQDDGHHAIYFNRGVAGSQAYTRLFGDYLRYYPVEVGRRDAPRVIAKPFIKPADVPDQAAYKWLSRGLEEGMLRFIGQAKGKGWSIRAAVYEFTWPRAVRAFADAIERGADVKVVHHRKAKSQFLLKFGRGWSNTSTRADGGAPDIEFGSRYGMKLSTPDGISQAAMNAVARMGVGKLTHFDALNEMLIPRTHTAISHNKFIVLLKDGEPQQVWTGSTNFTGGGIFGQSNVGHIVRDPDVAAQYLEYWNLLAADPKSTDSKKATAKLQADLKGPPSSGITCVFSPRKDKKMLQWYADRMAQAESSVFLTTAFTVDDSFLKVLKKTATVPEGKGYLRYVLAEGDGGHLKDKLPLIRKNPQNSVAWGDVLRTRRGVSEKGLLIESLTGLNEHVSYVHTKYMLIDPLGDDPIVISGSANFSDASTTKNDENMLVIRGNTRVADIFIGEFMRLFNHFQSRNTRNAMTDEEFERYGLLTADDSWTDAYYTFGTPEWNERQLFAGGDV